LEAIPVAFSRFESFVAWSIFIGFYSVYFGETGAKARGRAPEREGSENHPVDGFPDMQERQEPLRLNEP
jgi:hypothetical protein